MYKIFYEYKLKYRKYFENYSEIRFENFSYTSKPHMMCILIVSGLFQDAMSSYETNNLSHVTADENQKVWKWIKELEEPDKIDTDLMELR